MTRYLIPTLLLACVACAEFPTGRSFLSEMEHDDSSYFEPSGDFPIVGGDDEPKGMSLEDYRRHRLPRTEEEKGSDRERQLLSQELRSLESSQPEEEMEFYRKYRNRFTHTSEKIYFLKLPRGERRQYLQDRGFLESPTRAPASLGDSMRRSGVQLGMTKNDVFSSVGRPLRVEIAGNPSFENERWLYHFNGNSKYIYFESGVVQGWE